MENLRTRIRLGLPMPVWNTPRKTMPKAPAKKAWITPALSDLSPQGKVVSSPNSGTKPKRRLGSQALDANGTRKKKSRETTGRGNHMSCKRTQDTSVGNGLGNNENNSTYDSRVENDKNWAELANTDTFRRLSGLPEKSVGLDATDFAEGDHQRYSYSLESTAISPPASPREWLRRRGASLPHSRYFPPTSLDDKQAPAWVIEDGKLCIVFPQDDSPATFEIDVRAKIRLTPPSKPYRHSFLVPGLVRADGMQDRIRTGSFAFFVERPKWIPGAHGVRFGSKNLMDWRMKQSSHVIGRFRLDESPTLYVRIKAPVFHVLDFSAAVEMSTSLVAMTDRQVGLHYNAKVISEISDTDIFADRVELFVVVENGLLDGVKYQTDKGTCIVLHESILGPTGKKQNEALLKISRDSKDLQADINLNFTVPYQLGSGTTPHPTVRPLFGDVVSESIVIACPRLPLILEHVPQVQLSSWEVLHYNEPSHAIIRLDRLQMPKFFPEVLKDDPLIRIWELPRVPFRSLESADDALMTENPACVVRNLQFILHEMPTDGIACRISVDVEVGQNYDLLVIDPQGWNPCFSLIDNQLATEHRGQWRETTDKYLALFRADSMIQETVVHVVFPFQRRIRPNPSRETGSDVLSSRLSLDGTMYKMPKIIGKTSLGTIIKSDLGECRLYS